jgi:hypothetical protein
MSQFTSNVTGNLNTTTGVVPGVLSLINNRRTYLSSLTEFSSPRPAVTALAHMVHGSSDSVTFTATADGASKVVLWWSKNNGRFTSAPMLQDGTDATRWTIALPLEQEAGTYRYYCEASTTGGLASVFPPHAEYDSQSFTAVIGTASSPVVINEVMASNTKTIRDPQGEYDDWIELHNTSADTVRLGGLWMSDEPRPQWRFPSSALITPYGYLLVWADEDTLDGGALHANFKISKSGEGVYLWDSTGTLVLDSTTFGAQSDDRAWARIPDGSDSFQAAGPTPGSANGGPSGVNARNDQPREVRLGQNYPNPFNPSTTIPYALASGGRVRISVVDVLGRTVTVLVDRSQPAGSYTTSWHAEAASGVYISRMEVFPADGKSRSVLFHRKILLLR